MWSLPYIASALIEQEILGGISRGDDVSGVLDREIDKMHRQSDFCNASRVSFAWKRRNGVPTGKTFANANSVPYDDAPRCRPCQTSESVYYFANRRTLKEIGSPTTTMCTSSP
jgi:hypothetical protein